MAERTNVTRELSKLQKTVADLREEVLKSRQDQKSSNSSKMVLIARRAKDWLGLLADVFSLLIPAATIYLVFSNFISVPPTHSLKINDPLTIPFVIQNNSLINLRDLSIEIKLIDVQGETDTVRNMQFQNSTVHINDFLPSLKANSSHTLLFSTQRIVSAKYTRITQADIQIKVYYKALFFTKEFNQQFRFVALPGQEGFYEYYPVQPKI